MFSVLHFLENPFKLIVGMMKALAVPLGSPFPLAFGTFLWQNSLNFLEVGAYLEEKKVLSLVVQRDDPSPGDSVLSLFSFIICLVGEDSSEGKSLLFCLC